MYPIVLIAASAGALYPMRQIVAGLPVPCGAAVFVTQHIGEHRSHLPALLAGASGLPARHACDGDAIEAGHIYVAPSDHHMLLEAGLIRLDRGPKVHHARPAADPMFVSAARVYGTRVVGIVLSGGDGDGAIGLRVIKEHGGISFVQDPGTALVSGMPRSAIAADHPEVVSIAELSKRLRSMCSAS